jgi:hypothetical protein
MAGVLHCEALSRGRRPFQQVDRQDDFRVKPILAIIVLVESFVAAGAYGDNSLYTGGIELRYVRPDRLRTGSAVAEAEQDVAAAGLAVYKAVPYAFAMQQAFD